MEELRCEHKFEKKGWRRHVPVWFLPALVLVFLVLVVVPVTIILTLKGKEIVPEADELDKSTPRLIEAQPTSQAITSTTTTTTVAPPTTPCPPSNCSRMSCRSREFFDANGCSYCKCSDPLCEGLPCPKGSQCAIGYKPSAEENGAVLGAICVQVKKPGSCPPVDCKSGYVGGCEDDHDCIGDLKCCNYACDENLCLKPADLCSFPRDEGLSTCGLKFSMWYYDAARNDCFRFSVSICGGNSNQFDTKEDCLERCKK